MGTKRKHVATATTVVVMSFSNIASLFTPRVRSRNINVFEKISLFQCAVQPDLTPEEMKVALEILQYLYTVLLTKPEKDLIQSSGSEQKMTKMKEALTIAIFDSRIVVNGNIFLEPAICPISSRAGG